MLEITYEKIIEILNKENILIENNKLNNKIINHVSYDSRDIKENTLFFCKGMYYKEEYLIQAIDKGSVAYISEVKYEVDDVSYIIVSDVRKAMAVIAIEFYKHAYKDLETIAITGTKGKTTVTYFLKNILDEFVGSKIGVISTVEVYTGITQKDASLSTPEALELHKYLYEAVSSGIKYLAIEVTSQAYKMDRVYGVNFKKGMFLNISEDHISDVEHPDFEDYLNCKLQLMKNANNLIVNADMDEFDKVIEACENKPVTLYGHSKNTDYYYTNVEVLEEGFSFDVINHKLDYKNRFSISMQGRFNIENALAAVVAARNLGVDDNIIAKGLEKTIIKGRMNVLKKDGITVIIDYAHNELSFIKLYESIEFDYPKSKIISVGGCPGGKAYKRREAFARIIGEKSDYLYLTEDDPQYENVKDICDDIAKCFDDGVKYEVIESRVEAIEKAIGNANSGDVVVLVAKGEETYLKVKGELVDYESDLLIAKRVLGIE